MASPPPEPRTQALLRELTAHWDAAYEAVTSGDFERAGRLLAPVDQLLAAAPDPEATAAEVAALLQDAQGSHKITS